MIRIKIPRQARDDRVGVRDDRVGAPDDKVGARMTHAVILSGVEGSYCNRLIWKIPRQARDDGWEFGMTRWVLPMTGELWKIPRQARDDRWALLSAPALSAGADPSRNNRVAWIYTTLWRYLGFGRYMTILWKFIVTAKMAYPCGFYALWTIGRYFWQLEVRS
jgi:hypothetical protein